FLENKNTIQWQGSFDFDPLLNQKSLGQEDLDWLEEACEILPAFKHISIDQHVFHKENQEADELALVLAKLSEYLFQLKAKAPDLIEKNLHSRIQCTVPVGCIYFVEIAKLRALRLLWPNIIKNYGLHEAAVYIQTRNSPLFTHEDPYWNMLRHTTMAMIAVIGGADSIHLKIEGEKEAENPEFFQRIAINVQHILREESKLENVNDPANGSYYIENLSYQLAEKAWGKFQQIEAGGGFSKTEKQ
ncbi:MAG: methylmalonyl-CoA mutase family protein, partial [Chitinophagales bacterium]